MERWSPSKSITRSLHHAPGFSIHSFPPFFFLHIFLLAASLHSSHISLTCLCHTSRPSTASIALPSSSAFAYGTPAAPPVLSDVHGPPCIPSTPSMTPCNRPRKPRQRAANAMACSVVLVTHPPRDRDTDRSRSSRPRCVLPQDPNRRRRSGVPPQHTSLDRRNEGLMWGGAGRLGRGAARKDPSCGSVDGPIRWLGSTAPLGRVVLDGPWMVLSLDPRSTASHHERTPNHVHATRAPLSCTPPCAVHLLQKKDRTARSTMCGKSRTSRRKFEFEALDVVHRSTVGK